MLTVTVKSTHEEHLFQSLQTNKKQFKISNTSLRGYDGNFIVRKSYNKTYFTKSITDNDDFVQNTISSAAYKIEKLNNETTRKPIEKEDFTAAKYPFTNKSNFPTLESIKVISEKELLISFTPDDNTRDILDFH